jgi:hypothetical protein
MTCHTSCVASRFLLTDDDACAAMLEKDAPSVRDLAKCARRGF